MAREAGEVFLDESAPLGACGKYRVVAWESTPFGKVIGDVKSRRTWGGVLVIDEGDGRNGGGRFTGRLRVDNHVAAQEVAMAKDELYDLARRSTAAGKGTKAYSVLTEALPMPKFCNCVLELSLQNRLSIFLQLCSSREGTYPFLQYSPQIWVYIIWIEVDILQPQAWFGRGVQPPPIRLLLGFRSVRPRFHRNGKTGVPFSQATSHPTPDMFLSEVLWSADTAADEAIH